jgi:hypothetical protein
MRDVAMIKQNRADTIIKRFVEMDVYSQRAMLLNLLSYNVDDEVQYITYMLYDVITANNVSSSVSSGQNYVVGETLDTKDQMLIYDSFPWKAKMHFKDVMKFTVKYTQDMINKYDMNRVSIEQQIYLMKVPEYIKEKAIVKLKEIKGKGDDASSKAKQYLEGLLKIPFGVYKEEPILKKVKTNNAEFIQIISLLNTTNSLHTADSIATIPKKPRYTNIEMLKYTSLLKTNIVKSIGSDIATKLNTCQRNPLIAVAKYIHTLDAKYAINYTAAIPNEKSKIKLYIQMIFLFTLR